MNALLKKEVCAAFIPFHMHLKSYTILCICFIQSIVTCSSCASYIMVHPAQNYFRHQILDPELQKCHAIDISHVSWRGSLLFGLFCIFHYQNYYFDAPACSDFRCLSQVMSTYNCVTLSRNYTFLFRIEILTVAKRRRFSRLRRQIS